ncbi:unnamed protein product [Bursaphelenchus xylophilus]|uniref:(pine wood nematode) hypothetical protein n=1 Tax=Bursaphelenchus xylophilus TaxID=6326 RepID=A0A1I7RSM5_BURXY|nr:unnamed protein product [Bursaphelenchus xylophilus]CAG9122868.1 unnamed protein product [Bursaphelenchus xylophilus]
MRRSILVERVNGPGCEDSSCSESCSEVEVVIGKEHLHANGVFSNVYRAVLYSPRRQPVAIKKIWPDKSHPDAAEKEIELLTKVNHECVVKLLYRFKLGEGSQACDCLIMDFLPIDLSKLRLSQPNRRFHPLDVKLYSFQMFAGIDHISSKDIIHCDIKPSNLIVDPELGLLKIADFGNARILKKSDKVDSYQVTRYYRAPELVFGCTNFTVSVDRWSCACVLSEIILGKPLLQGKDKLDQGRVIIEMLGYPSSSAVKAMNVSRPRISRKPGRGLKPLIAGYDFPPEAEDIVSRILVYEPRLRMRPEEVMGHKYYDELRRLPPAKRENGRKIPSLNYWTIEQSTQSDRTRRPTT